MLEAGEHRGSRFRSPALQTRVSIRSVSNQSQVIGYGSGLNSESLDNACLIAQGAFPAIELHNPRATDTLGEIFVGRADENAIHPLILRCGMRG